MERQSDRNQGSEKGGRMSLDNMKKLILRAIEKARKNE